MPDYKTLPQKFTAQMEEEYQVYRDLAREAKDYEILKTTARELFRQLKEDINPYPKENSYGFNAWRDFYLRPLIKNLLNSYRWATERTH